MRWLVALAILVACFLVLRDAWRFRQAERAARREPMPGLGLLTKDEQAAWNEIERGYKRTAEADD